MKVEKEKAVEGSNAQCRLGLHCNATSDGRFDSRGLLHVLLLSKKQSHRREERERKQKRKEIYQKKEEEREIKRLVWCSCFGLVSFLAPTFLSSHPPFSNIMLFSPSSSTPTSTLMALLFLFLLFFLSLSSASQPRNPEGL